MKSEFVKGLKEGQKEFGETISTIINTVLLSFVYIIGVGLTSIFAKLCGKKFLNMKFEKKDSYWTDLSIKAETKEDCLRQF